MLAQEQRRLCKHVAATYGMVIRIWPITPMGGIEMLWCSRTECGQAVAPLLDNMEAQNAHDRNYVTIPSRICSVHLRVFSGTLSMFWLLVRRLIVRRL